MADIAWTTPEMKNNLQKELDSLIAFRDGRIIKTEEMRQKVVHDIRILEVLIHGEARTALPPRHNE